MLALAILFTEVLVYPRNLMKPLFIRDFGTFFSSLLICKVPNIYSFFVLIFTSAVERFKQRDNNYFCRNHIIKLHQFKGNCVAVYIDSSCTAKDEQTFLLTVTVLLQVSKHAGSQKNPKVLAESLNWLSDSIKGFGFK